MKSTGETGLEDTKRRGGQGNGREERKRMGGLKEMKRTENKELMRIRRRLSKGNKG